MRNKLILLIVIFSFVAACAKSEAPEAKTGGQDGGGGEIATSTSKQVEAALAQAYEIAGHDTNYSNIYVRYWISESNGYAEQAPAASEALFPKYKFDAAKGWKYSDFSSPPLRALLGRPPLLKMSGDCEQSSRAHADAAVSSYDLDGRVCFSVGNLMRLPPSALLPEILSLMIHEAIHMAGEHSEQIAETWQNSFRDYFRWRFGGLDAEQTEVRTEQMFFIAMGYLGKAKNLNITSPGNLSIYTVMGAYAHIIGSLPRFMDPVSLNLSIHPANPDVVNNYSNSVLRLYELVRTDFFNEDKDFVRLRPAAIERILKKIGEAQRDAHQNFIAYTKGNRPSVCVLPTFLDLPEELEYEHNLIRKIGARMPRKNYLMPPHECSPGTAEKTP